MKVGEYIIKTYKVGIIGSGVISRTYVADIQKFYKTLEVVACSANHIESARKLANEFNIPKACSTEQLLADPSIDIAVNLTPPQEHLPVDRMIIAAGKHLYSEKPFASTLNEAKELLAIAKKSNIHVACAPDTFLGSGLQSVRYYLDNGIIGKPFFVTANMTTFGAETWHPNPAPFYKEGAGPVMDMAPYYLTAIVSLLGPIKEISAYSTKPSDTRHIYTGPQAGADIDVDVPTHFSSLMQLNSGVIVNFNVSFDIYRSNLPKFEIYGSEGTLCYPDPNFTGGTPSVYRKEQYTDPSFNQAPEITAKNTQFYELPEILPRFKEYSRGAGVAALARAIETGKEDLISNDFILHITEALEALTLSAQTGEKIHLTTTCDRPSRLRMGLHPGEFA